MFAVLHVPHFRLQAVLRLREDGVERRPVAVVDGGDRKSVILEANAAAAAQKVRPGMATAQALARCAELQLLPRDADQERSAQAALLETALSLAPDIESTAPGLATLHLRLPNPQDWRRIGQAAVDSLAGLRLQAQAGMGSNPDLAFLAARRAAPVLVVQNAAEFLDSLPVSELDPPPKLLELLRDWGIRTLHDLRSLPPGDLADRLGPEAFRLWELASGQVSRPLQLVQPAAEFVESFSFEHEVETLEPLLFLLRRFLDQLTRRIRSQWRVAGEMTLTLPLENGQLYERQFTIPTPTADADTLFRILHTHLENLRLDHRPLGLRLEMRPAPVSNDQLQLFETALRDPNRLGETMARLAVVAGGDKAGVVQLQDTHRPDSWTISPPQFHRTLAESPPAGRPTGLPLRRLRPPVTAAVKTARHIPCRVESALLSGSVREALGPYRISGHWWEPDAWAAEEWDAELECGSLLRLTRSGNDWSITGIYEIASQR